MTTRNRVLTAALLAAVVLVPVGAIPAQETQIITEGTGGGRTVIVKSSGGPVVAEAPAASPTSGPSTFAPSGEAVRPGGSEGPRRSGRSPRGPDGPPPKPSEGPQKSDQPPSKSGEEKGKSGEEKKSEEPAKPVQRPSTPPEPADPELIRKMRLDENGKVRLNFTGHPWPDVLRWLAQISGLSLDWQELPGDYLNLITQRSYSLDEVRDMINRHLLARGYTMVRQGEVLWVVKLEKLDPSMVPRVEPDELDKRDPHEFVKVSFPLDWLLADEAVEELQPLLSPHGKLTALNATNRLEAMDAVVNLRELRKFLKEEQSTETQQGLVREFELKYARAEDVREQVLALLGTPAAKSGGPSGPMNPQQMEQMRNQMQQQMQQMQQQMQQQMAQQQGGKKLPGIKRPKPQSDVNLVVNKRKNSIVAYAPPDKMMLIDQAIKVLDVRPNGSDSPAALVNRTQVYRLETVDPEAVVKTLEELGDLDPNTRLEVDRQNRLIIAHATLIDHATIQLLVNKLDGGGRRCHVIPLKDLRAESVAETITFMMGGGKKEEAESDSGRRGYSSYDYPFGGSSLRYRAGSQGSSDAFRVEPDVRNNALVLWANEFELAKVKELLEDLRKLPPKDGDGYTAHVYRLAAIDPEPVVKTLTDMDTLGPHATLQVDKPNKAIIAYASAADHEKISKLLETLDGSARKFAVIKLRRLEADYVAGTIEFMMGGGEKKEKSYSRYDYYPYTDLMRPQSKEGTDQFRVDADVEFNRLLMWANEIELQEVQNLLAKLGEIPAEGGSPDTVRILDTGGGPELEALIERIRRTWTAPNELIVIPPEKPEEATPGEPIHGPASPSKDTTTQTSLQPLFRFAEFRQEDAHGEALQAPGEAETPAEVWPAPGKGVPSAEVPPDPATGDAGAAAASDPATGAPRAEASPGPGNGASPGAGEGSAKPPAPVRISWGPDGRVIIASEDPKALDELQDVLSRYAPPRRDYKVFHLKYALAYWVSLNLEDFFREEEKSGGRGRSYDIYDYLYGYGGRDTGDEGRARLSKRRTLKFIADSDTNTILVQGADAGQLKTTEELIKLYDQPEPKDTQSLRMTRVFHLKYSKAQVVADAIKDVYRDLLSSNDKALQGPGQGQQPRAERSYTFSLGSDDGGTAQKMPRWRGQLSIGIDELANALVVSAPAYLFADVSKMIDELDQAAEPVSTVRVMKVDGRLSAAGLQDKLSEALGGRSSASRQPSGRPPSGRPPLRRPGQPPGPQTSRNRGSSPGNNR